MIRLQKHLAAAGVCSRRKAEDLIQDGRVCVNGAVADRLGSKVDPQSDTVTVDGRPVHPASAKIYILLNKPPGYVSSCYQQQEKTIMELVDVNHRVFPVGRLDKESTGLMLLTNDGELHNRLSHPSFDHEKTYEVTAARTLSNAELRRLREGVRIRGKKTRPARVVRLSGRRFQIILREGRNRQIRRMVGKLGTRVVDLRRIKMADISVKGLAQGQWRYLTEGEKKRLFADKGL